MILVVRTASASQRAQDSAAVAVQPSQRIKVLNKNKPAFGSLQRFLVDDRSYVRCYGFGQSEIVRDWVTYGMNTH